MSFVLPSMKIFITGGAGFIGSHTVDLALREGHQVTVYDVKTWAEAVNLHHIKDQINYIEGDIVNFALLKNSMAGHSHVLHLAAVVSVQKTIAEPLSSHEVNVTGALNVFESARLNEIKRVVYASSAAVYGANGNKVSEETRCEPLSPYGLHKQINDQYSEQYNTLFGQLMLGLRYFNVYGPRQAADSPYSGVIAIFTSRAREGKEINIYGDGLATRDYVSVYDVARANLLALLSDKTGLCNIASGQTVTVNDLVNSIEQVLDKPITKNYLPERQGDIRHSSANTDLAKSLIGFEAKVLFSEGLEELLS
jgi:UDP-glucose 4-epimerase